MTTNQSVWLGATMLAGVVLLVGFGWLNCGYGEVSPLTYEYSKALYSACLNKNEEHLSKVDELLASNNATDLPVKERQWINALVAEARDGDWQAAAKKARQIMEDQVQY